MHGSPRGLWALNEQLFEQTKTSLIIDDNVIESRHVDLLVPRVCQSRRFCF